MRTFAAELELIICREMDTETLLAWGDTSAARLKLSRAEFRRRSHEILALYVEDLPRFLTLMRHYRVFYSGSRALQLLLWNMFETTASDLDLYVPLRSYFAVRHHLTTVQGYQYNGEVFHQTDPDYEILPGIFAIARLTKGNKKIDLIVSINRAAWLPIPYFWSTLVMNVVGPDCIICAYPRFTLSKRGVVNFMDRHSSISPSHPPLRPAQKYASRGFDVRVTEHAWGRDENASDDNFSCGEQCLTCVHVPRFFGDSRSLVVDIRDPGAITSGSPLFLPSSATVSWRLGGVQHGYGEDMWFRRPMALTRPFRSPYVN